MYCNWLKCVMEGLEGCSGDWRSEKAVIGCKCLINKGKFGKCVVVLGEG